MTSPLPAPEPAPASRRRRDRRALVTASLVGVATLFVVWNLSPWIWFTDTTPTGGDMGAHVWSPAYLRDELLPNWRLTGWSPDWYAGFPAFTFYMIIPSLLIVIVNVGLDVSLGPLDLDVSFFSFVGVALGVGEITRRLGLRDNARLLAVFVATAVGVALSAWFDGDRFDLSLLGWSPIEPFVYDDGAIDLAIAAIALPIAMGSLVWRIVPGGGGRRVAVSAAAVMVTLLAVPIPYGVAMKLVVVAGMVTLPAAAFGAGRLGGLAFPGPALMAVMTLPFLFDRSYNIYGGNLMSTMAGEFAYSLGLSLAVLYLGVAARGMRTGRDRGLAAVLLALAGLTHLFSAFFALVGTVALFLVRPGRREVSWLTWTGPLAALLSAFWVLPFFWNRSLLNDMGWGKERRYVAALWNRSGGFGDQDFLVNDPPLQIFVILAIVGAVVCGLRRVRFGMALSMVAMMFAAAFLLLPEGRLWNVRLLPFYYLAVYLMAAIAIAEVSRLMADGLRSRPAILEGRSTAAAGILAAVATVVVLVGLAFPLRSVPLASTFQRDDGATVYGYGNVLGLEDLGGLGDFATTQLNLGPGWLRYNFAGYEEKPGTAEYTDLVATMDRVGGQFGCGQSLWEFESARLGSYGTTMAPMLLPHWTDGCIGSMEGLYFEASATTPYHFLLQSELSSAPSRAQRDLPYSALDVAKGVDGMQALGVRYYMAFSEAALAQARAEPRLEEIATSGPWVIFLLVDHDVVRGLDHLPVVVDGLDAGGEDWLVPTVAAWDAGPGLALLAASGPDDWPRQSLDDFDHLDDGAQSGGDDRVSEIRALTERLPDRLERAAVEPAEVTDVSSDESSISFSVDRTGTPVLVRASYFPNWDVSGADGPYRVSPNLMVVVPTETEVELTYGRSGVEIVGMVLTIVGLIGLVAMGRYPLGAGGGALWDLASGDDLPERDEVLADVRAGTRSLADVGDLDARNEERRRAATRHVGAAIALCGVSLLLAAVFDVGADRPFASIVVFAPLAVGVVVAVFRALPLLVRAVWYRRAVLAPATMIAEVLHDADSATEP